MSRRRIVVLAAVATVAALPGMAGAQTPGDAGLRARQLEVFEELLTRTFREHVESTVMVGIEEERTQDSDGDGEPDAPVVVRVGATAAAHGLYIAGYGVLFSIQQPQVSVLPRAFALYLREPMGTWRAELREEAHDQAHSAPAEMLRMQSALVERQLGQMLRLLEREVQSDPGSAQIEEIQARVAALRGNLIEIQARVETMAAQGAAGAATPRPDLQVQAGATRDDEVRRREVRVEAVEPYGMLRGMAEHQRAAAVVLERNYRRMRAAVTEATIDSLAHYGSVITGLADDDRLSILVLPPNPWGMPMRQILEEQTEESEEYVISIRYRDIREYNSQRIDLEEFRARVRIHDRLGLEVPHEESEQD